MAAKFPEGPTAPGADRRQARFGSVPRRLEPVIAGALEGADEDLCSHNAATVQAVGGQQQQATDQLRQERWRRRWIWIGSRRWRWRRRRKPPGTKGGNEGSAFASRATQGSAPREAAGDADQCAQGGRLIVFQQEQVQQRQRWVLAQERFVQGQQPRRQQPWRRRWWRTRRRRWPGPLTSTNASTDNS